MEADLESVLTSFWRWIKEAACSSWEVSLLQRADGGADYDQLQLLLQLHTAVQVLFMGLETFAFCWLFWSNRKTLKLDFIFFVLFFYFLLQENFVQPFNGNCVISASFRKLCVFSLRQCLEI